jgi:hypothetical protein
VAFFFHGLDVVVNKHLSYEWKYVQSCINFSLAANVPEFIELVEAIICAITIIKVTFIML